MRSMFAALPLLFFSAGCAGAPPHVEGRVVYRAAGERGASVVILTTRPIEGRIERSAPDLSRALSRVETPLAPSEMAALLDLLESEGFFELPGPKDVPAEFAPRSIAVEAGERRFYVALQDLKDEAQVAVYARAARRVIAFSQAGPHYALPKAP
jgi:hypothetical protein